MQHDQSKTTGLRKIDRVRNCRTPDRLDVRNMDLSMMNTFSPKRKLHTSRMSTVPAPNLPTPTVTNLRKLELENNNLELELTYSEYVASFAELILEKKILKDTEVSFCNSMKSICEDVKSLQEKCKLIETRIRDVRALSCLNDYIDIVQSNTQNFKDKIEKYEINNILLQLEKLLERFNVLRCENITIPNTIEELKEFEKTLKGCQIVLQQISNPDESEILEHVAENYEEFITMFQEISNVKKIVEEKISNLQAEVLKTCSHFLSQSNI